LWNSYQDCLRGANDKYKGIQPFRATLSDETPGERQPRLFHMLAPGLVQAGLIFLRHGQISISSTHKSLCCNSQQAISHVARDRNDAIDM
jgi:hypothetical protein